MVVYPQSIKMHTRDIHAIKRVWMCALRIRRGSNFVNSPLILHAKEAIGTKSVCQLRSGLLLSNIENLVQTRLHKSQTEALILSHRNFRFASHVITSSVKKRLTKWNYLRCNVLDLEFKSGHLMVLKKHLACCDD